MKAICADNYDCKKRIGKIPRIHMNLMGGYLVQNCNILGEAVNRDIWISEVIVYYVGRLSVIIFDVRKTHYVNI